jgi:biotin carboxyl carrier protein
VARNDGKGRWNLHLRGQRFEAEVLDSRTRSIREMTGAGAGPTGPVPVKAPMPGLMVKVEVEVGDIVEAGQGVAIVEAMKMENELKAQGPGKVHAIHVAEGDTVEKDQVLVDFTSLEEESVSE